MKTKAAIRTRERAIVYYRVSTDEQDDQSQLRELRQYAKANGFTIVREVSEGESWSGADSERPQWLDIMQRAESADRDFDFLLGCEYDRFGRNRHTREDISDLVDMGVNVIFIRDGLDTRDPNSELILDIKGNLSTGYRKSVSNHTRAKMLDRARQKLATGKPPFGYSIKVEGGTMQTKHGVKRLVGAKRTMRSIQSRQHGCRAFSIGTSPATAPWPSPPY
jgi:DNA invertase Pin-like site-specific DNA recombinase